MPKLKKGINDLKTLRPDLIDWWNPEENGPYTLEDFTKGSSFEASWICPIGHHFKQTILRRYNGRQCPVCCGQIVTKDNCLSALFPDVAEEWDYEKNKPITPNDITYGTKKKYWWKCPNGHESYLAAVCSRTSLGTGCPKCNSEKRTSFPEQILRFYLSQRFNVLNRYRINGFEADVFCDDIKLAIEYDGEFFHKGKESEIREQKKNNFFKENNILLIRIKEHKKRKTDYQVVKTDYGYLINCEYDFEYNFVKKVLTSICEIIANIFSINVNLDVDIQRDKTSIISIYADDKVNNSFLLQKPLGAKKFDFNKNGDIDLRLLPKTSKKKFWWKCPTCGNEWYGPLDNIVDSLTCNKCSRTYETEYKLADEIYAADVSFKVIGNNLKVANPILASQWHPSKNGNFKPENVSAKSGKRVWWLCPVCGYEWTQIIKTRNNGVGARMCPKCSNNQRIKTSNTENQINDFSDLLKQEFHPTKNGSMKLSDYTTGSDKVAWWRCSKCSYEWKAPIKTRTKGSNCPKCANESRARSKHKKVINVETGVVYPSIKDAALELGIERSGISNVLKGRGKTAGGYHWKYVD